MDTSLGDGLQGSMCISDAEGQGLFTENVFSCSRCLADAFGMELVGCGDHNTVNVLALQHVFEGGECVFDFKFLCHLPGLILCDVGPRNQPGLRHKAADVLRMP